MSRRPPLIQSSHSMIHLEQTLRLPKAPLPRRYGAGAIDCALIFLGYAALVSLMTLLSVDGRRPGPHAMYALGTTVALVAYVVVPLRLGGTIGMRLLGLKIVDMEDSPPIPLQIGLRGVVSTVAFVLFIPLFFQAIAIYVSKEGRSLSDDLAGTRVVLDPDREVG